MIPYMIAQVAGAIVAAAVLYAIASGKPDWVAGGFASNGFGNLSPGKYGLMSCLFSEVIATFFFLYVIIGTTSKGAAVGFAGISNWTMPDTDQPVPDSGHKRVRQPGS